MKSDKFSNSKGDRCPRNSLDRIIELITLWCLVHRYFFLVQNTKVNLTEHCNHDLHSLCTSNNIVQPHHHACVQLHWITIHSGHGIGSFRLHCNDHCPHRCFSPCHTHIFKQCPPSNVRWMRVLPFRILRIAGW